MTVNGRVERTAKPKIRGSRPCIGCQQPISATRITCKACGDKARADIEQRSIANPALVASPLVKGGL